MTEIPRVEFAREETPGAHKFVVAHEWVDVHGTAYEPDDLDGLQVTTSRVRYDGVHDGMHFVTLVHYIR